jgi:hypothetical protein
VYCSNYHLAAIKIEAVSDTIIKGKPAKKLLVYYRYRGRFQSREEFIAQEGREIFCYNRGVNSLFTLYDLSKSAGDVIRVRPGTSIPWPNEFSYKITESGLDSINNVQLITQRVESVDGYLTFEAFSNYPDYDILEKVGSLRYFWGENLYLLEDTEYYNCLYYQDHEIFWKDEGLLPMEWEGCDFPMSRSDVFADLQIYNSDGNITIRDFGHKAPDIEVFDILGRTVTYQAISSDRETLVIALDNQPKGVFLVRASSLNDGYAASKTFKVLLF